jgi:predicted amidohydrolase YtcJ
MRANRADAIFRNGDIWTGAQAPPQRAIAVAKGRIVAVGDADEVMNLRQCDTRLVDLEGQTLIPGFVDAHAHIWKIGHLLTTLIDLRHVESVAELGQRLRDEARRLPAGAWLRGRGYNEARFTEGRAPTRADLDALISDRPIVLMRTCAHIVVCNSLALERAGIDRNTRAPAGGEIDRVDGEPTGVLRENAIALAWSKAPQPTSDEYAAMITAGLRHQLSMGITSTTDAGVGPPLAETYRKLDVEGRLPCRVNVMALGVADGGGAIELPSRHVSQRLRIDTIKFFADGGLSGATAALSVPYRHADTYGVLRFEHDELLALARDGHEAGWRIATHAIGDRAIDQVLGAYEALGRGAMRHRIEHFGLPTAQHLERAARLGVIVVPQTIFVHTLGRNFRRYLPDALLARVYPVRAMIDTGLTVALSSDAPVVEDDSPLIGMQAAMLRRDDEGHAIASAEAITLDEALGAYTTGGAVASGDDGNRGCLREGMWADFAVLSGSPRNTPAEALTTLRVTQTWVDGHEMFAQ